MAEINKPNTLNKVWGASNLVTPPSDSKISLGWTVEIPTWEDFQWLDNRQDQFIAYLNQHGLPEWDAVTEYQTNKSYIMGSNGNIFRCILTNTNIDPVSSPLTATYWVKAFDVSDYAYSKAASDNKYLVKTNNLSDITSQASARTNLGLGTSSTLNAGTTAGQVMTVGSFGLGSTSSPAAIPSNDCNSITASGFYGGSSTTANRPTISGTLFDLIHITDDATNSTQIAQDLHSTSNIWSRSKVNGVWGAWGRNYNSNFSSAVVNSFMSAPDAPSARAVIGVGNTGALNGTGFMNSGIVNWPDAATARAGLALGNIATYNFAQSLANTGYYMHPGGFIIQWGSSASSGTASNNGVVSLPISFPTAGLWANGTITGQGTLGNYTIQTFGANKTQAIFSCLLNGALASGIGFFWIAIGY